MSSEGEGLPAEEIAAAVRGIGLSDLPDGAAERFSLYFDLLRRWNAKLNLTALRTADEVLRRHFLECIFCAQRLPGEIRTLLDYGSGAGFPGIPIALCRPEIRVALAESQRKKASFLREAARSLEIEAEVYSGRVEEMDRGRQFDAVALRAVDKMETAFAEAGSRVREGGWLAVLTAAGALQLPPDFAGGEQLVPGSERRVLLLARARQCSTWNILDPPNVPRGTS